MYAHEGIALSDLEGRYELRVEGGREINALLALEQHSLHLARRVRQLKSDPEGRVHVPPIPLFPSATIKLEVKDEDDRLSVDYEWRVRQENNPPWADFFFAPEARADLTFEPHQWLKVNQEQEMRVPAGVEFRLRLRSYNEKVPQLIVPDTLRVGPGETLHLGTFRLDPTRVRVIGLSVVNPTGKPLQGIPVWKQVQGETGDEIGGYRLSDKEGRIYLPLEEGLRGFFFTGEPVWPVQETRFRIKAHVGFDDFKTSGDARIYKLIVLPEDEALIRKIDFSTVWPAP
jgi:hypothetical protein